MAKNAAVRAVAATVLMMRRMCNSP